MSDTRFDLEEGGGGIDGFTGTVTEAYFQPGEYGLSLLLKSTFDDPENYPQFEDGSYTQFYSCGKDWQTTDNGETATHPGGPDKRYNKSSKVGQLVAQFATIPGVAEKVPADWSAYRAASWKGLHLVWGRVPVERRKQVEGEWKTVTENVLMPVGFAGDGAVSGNGAAPATFDITTLNLTADQHTALTALAQSSDTPTKFVEGIVALGAEYVGNSALMGAVGKDAAAVKSALEPF